MTDTPTLTVCYNGACPVCRGEMEHYQRIAERAAADGRALPLGWNDFNTAPDLFRLHNIDFDTAMRRLHAVDAQGRLIRGIDVFVAIWRILPRHRWAAAIVGFPLIRPLAWLAYEGVVAPLVFRWSRRRWRRAQARAARPGSAG
jgi:predicted DCC family thiol-disulfide oxidoreductase YuxK